MKALPYQAWRWEGVAARWRRLLAQRELLGLLQKVG